MESLNDLGISLLTLFTTLLVPFLFLNLTEKNNLKDKESKNCKYCHNNKYLKTDSRGCCINCGAELE